MLNRLVGNDDDAAVLETAGGLRVRARGAVVAAAAERAPRALAAGESSPRAGREDPVELPRRARRDRRRTRARLAQPGLPLGPRPAAGPAGEELPVGADPGTPIVVDQAPARRPPARSPCGRDRAVDWFAAGALDLLPRPPWTVSPDVSRVGVRLAGRRWRAADAELPSEGLVTGAIQVPTDGRPVVMLADHPTTGGYPVLAVVDPAPADRRPGAPRIALRFRVLRYRPVSLRRPTSS